MAKYWFRKSLLLEAGPWVVRANSSGRKDEAYLKAQSAPDYLETSLSHCAKRINDCDLIIENIVRNEINQEILDETLLKHFFVRPMQEMTKFKGSKYISQPVEIRIKLAVPELISQSNHGYSAESNHESRHETAASDATAAAADSTATAAVDRPKPGSESKLFDLIEPRYALDQVYLPQPVREQIIEALLLVQNRAKLFNDWGLESTVKKGTGLVFNFYGPPGTGKSITAEAIANEIGRPVMLVNYPNLESKYVGETPKNIQKVFADAKQHDAILVFDEADSFLSKRLTSVTQAADYGVNVTRSTMFMEIENYSGIVIFTTNLIRNYDAAFMRRILASVEFTLPDQHGREVIWRLLLPSKMPLSDAANPAALAERYTDLTGADIKDVILLAALSCTRCQAECVDLRHFDLAYERILKRRLPEPELEPEHNIVMKEEEAQCH